MNYATARKHMVDSQVRPNDVPDLRLQLAMEEMPKEAFVTSDQQSMAYAELDLPLFDGRCLLQARDFSKLIHAARIKDTDLVLDLGCGYGYSTAVLSHLASMVMALEVDEAVVASAEERLAALSLDNVAVVQGELKEGLAKQGPFDVIVIAAGAVEVVPEALLDQLKDGGRLVCIKQVDGLGHACVYTRSGDNIGEVASFEAMPMAVIPEFSAEKSFVF